MDLLAKDTLAALGAGTLAALGAGTLAALGAGAHRSKEPRASLKSFLHRS